MTGYRLYKNAIDNCFVGKRVTILISDSFGNNRNICPTITRQTAKKVYWETGMGEESSLITKVSIYQQGDEKINLVKGKLH